MQDLCCEDDHFRFDSLGLLFFGFLLHSHVPPPVLNKIHFNRQATFVMTARPKSALLHGSCSGSTILLDIPFSLALAQHPSISDLTQTFHLPLSAPALSEPYPSTEPKSAKARQRVIERLGDNGTAVVDEAWIQDELEGLRKGYADLWCLERCLVPELVGNEGRAGKRKKEDRHEEDGESTELSDKEDAAMGLAQISENSRPEPIKEPGLRLSSIGEHSWEVARHDPNPLLLLAGGMMPCEHLFAKEVGNRLISNLSKSTVSLTLGVSNEMNGGSPTYTLPPLSSFLLSTIDLMSIKTFSGSAFTLLPSCSKSAGPGQFDFVLLDPPWDNRSARRSNQYQTMDKRNGDMDPVIALEGLLEQHIAPNGLVGLWITNKATVREKAFRLFESWGVTLEQEWVWLKVTTSGEPVTELGGLWRKPYEVLLLGRKSSPDGTDKMLVDAGTKGDKTVKRKLIIAVPDLHSRKPSLKELIEPMMPDTRSYRALEVFARHLTTGWWAWGDECLRYNWTGYWSSNRSRSPATLFERNDVTFGQQFTDWHEERHNTMSTL